MPLEDMTGPRGLGPMTGRGLGWCTEFYGMNENPLLDHYGLLGSEFFDRLSFLTDLGGQYDEDEEEKSEIEGLRERLEKLFDRLLLERSLLNFTGRGLGGGWRRLGRGWGRGPYRSYYSGWY